VQTDGIEPPGKSDGWPLDQNQVWGFIPGTTSDAFGSAHFFKPFGIAGATMVTDQACWAKTKLPPRPHLAKPVVAAAAGGAQIAVRATIITRQAGLRRLSRGRAYLPNPLIRGAAPPVGRGTFIGQARQAAQKLITVRPKIILAKPVVAAPAGAPPVPKGLIILQTRVRRALATVPLKPKLARGIVQAAPRAPPALVISRMAKLRPPFVPPTLLVAPPVVAIGPAADTRALIIQTRYRIGRGHVLLAKPVLTPAGPVPVARGTFVQTRYRIGRGRVLTAKPVVAPPSGPPVARGTIITSRFRITRGRVYPPNPLIQGAAPPLPRGTFVTTRYKIGRGRVITAKPVIATTSAAPLAPRALIITTRYKVRQGKVLLAEPIVVTPVATTLWAGTMVRVRTVFRLTPRPHLARPVVATTAAAPPVARGTFITVRARLPRGSVRVAPPLLGPPPLPPVARGTFITARNITRQPPKPHLAGPVVSTTAPTPLAPRALVISTRTQFRLPPKPHLARAVLGQPVVSRGTFIHGIRNVIKLPPRPHLAIPIISTTPLAAPVARGTLVSRVAQLRPAPAPIRPHLAPPIIGAHVEPPVVETVPPADPWIRPKQVFHGKGTVEYVLELGTAMVLRHYGDEDRHRAEENWLVLGITPPSWDDHADD
jgi:hypothetical protein